MSENRIIVRNAAALALRMVLVTLVGLYTSRIVLEALGISDYGVYGVVGGIVGLAGFLNASMAGAVSRFITVELGKGNRESLREVFTTSILIHSGLAVVAILLAETVGLWFLNHKLVIPGDNLFAANIVFHLSVASIVLGFTQVPYNAVIIAHEKMSVYAYLELVNVGFKLLIAMSLSLIGSDKLIFYATMLFVASVLNVVISRWYCIRTFPEARLSVKCINAAVARKILVFAGFDFYGNMCVAAKSQGQPIVLNLFFGVIANAAASIVLTVSGAISGLTLSIAQAFRPRIFKSYAAGDIDTMARMMRMSMLFTVFAYTAIALPVIVEAGTILNLWLGRIPQYSVIFLRLTIVAAIINIVIGTNNAAIHATGNIKSISFLNGTLYLLCPVISYCCMKWLACPAASIYAVDILMLGVVAVSGWFIIRRQLPEFRVSDYSKAALKSGIAAVVSLAVVIAVVKCMPFYETVTVEAGFGLMLIRVMLTTLISMAVLTLFSIIIAFGREERQIIKLMVLKYARRIVPVRQKCVNE